MKARRTPAAVVECEEKNQEQKERREGVDRGAREGEEESVRPRSWTRERRRDDGRKSRGEFDGRKERRKKRRKKRRREGEQQWMPRAEKPKVEDGRELGHRSVRSTLSIT